MSVDIVTKVAINYIVAELYRRIPYLSNLYKQHESVGAKLANLNWIYYKDSRIAIQHINDSNAEIIRYDMQIDAGVIRIFSGSRYYDEKTALNKTISVARQNPQRHHWYKCSRTPDRYEEITLANPQSLTKAVDILCNMLMELDDFGPSAQNT